MTKAGEQLIEAATEAVTMAKLMRENERLREALVRIALRHGAPACDTGGYYEDIAKEALAWEVLA